MAHESLEALDQMVDVAEELGVDAIGLNHLMFSTPEEVAETVRLIGAADRLGDRHVRHARPGLDIERVRAAGRRARAEVQGEEHPVRLPAQGAPAADRELLHAGREARGRCLYPFLHARVSFSGKVYFCPFIRVEVGDLSTQTLEEIWNGDSYVAMRRRLVENGIFPVCRRCCKVELSPQPVAEPFGAGVPAPARRAIPLTVVR